MFVRTDRSGFVLLEAIAALMIVSITSVALLSMISAQLRARERAQWLVTADALARDRLVQLETLERADLELLPDSLRKGIFATPFEAYRWSSRAEQRLGMRDLFLVTVEVSWRDERQVLQTEFYRPRRKAAR